MAIFSLVGTSLIKQKHETRESTIDNRRIDFSDAAHTAVHASRSR